MSKFPNSLPDTVRKDLINAVLDYGIDNTGATDQSAQIQAMIDANKGQMIYFPKGSYLCAGLLLDGATYNNTKLWWEGELLLAPDGGASHAGGSWIGLRLKECDGVQLEFNGNGNRAAMTATREQILMVAIEGATNVNIPTFRVREIRGDGLYLTNEGYNTPGANVDGVTIGTFDGWNTVDDGRNGITIISGKNISIASFNSRNIGSFINGVLMPGGLDLEPNNSFQEIDNVTVGSASVVGMFTSGLAIQGQPNKNCQNVSVGAASVVNTCAPDIADNAGTNQSDNHILLIANATGVSVNGFTGRFTQAYGDAVVVAGSDRVSVNAEVFHVREALRCGVDSSNAGVRLCIEVRCKVASHDISRQGIRVGETTDCFFEAYLYSPRSDMYSSRWGLFLAGGAVGPAQTRTTYSLNIPYSATWNRSIRQDPTFGPTYDAYCQIADCNMQGFAHSAIDAPLMRYNVRGISDSVTIPNGGVWAPYQVVNKRPVTTGAGQVVGWYRATGGTTNTLNTDWFEIKADVGV